MDGIINVVEVIDGIVKNINSYSFSDGSRYDEIAARKDAKNLFLSKIKTIDNNITDERLNDIIDTGYYWDDNNYELYLMLSE